MFLVHVQIRYLLDLNVGLVSFPSLSIQKFFVTLSGRTEHFLFLLSPYPPFLNITNFWVGPSLRFQIACGNDWSWNLVSEKALKRKKWKVVRWEGRAEQKLKQGVQEGNSLPLTPWDMVFPFRAALPFVACGIFKEPLIMGCSRWWSGTDGVTRRALLLEKPELCLLFSVIPVWLEQRKSTCLVEMFGALSCWSYNQEVLSFCDSGMHCVL